mmetsp:Transcript_4158/g.10743  ORF Transcript_4158/g.10743 Transcript_4158/m.10743 type:complete len:565 (+) Transcript_4158:181-1875(+)
MLFQLWWLLGLVAGVVDADLSTRGAFLKPWQPSRHRRASTRGRRQVTPLPSASPDRQIPAVEQPPAPITGSSSPTYIRPLGSWERLLTKTQRNDKDAPLSVAGFSVDELSGTSSLTRDDVRRALRRAVSMHPLLRVQIAELPAGNEFLRRKDKEWPWFYPLDASADELVDRALVWADVDTRDGTDLRKEWRTLVEGMIDGVTFAHDAPLWRLHVIHSPSAGRSALVWLFNHAIADQISAQVVLQDFLTHLQPHQSSDKNTDSAASVPVSFPPSMEAMLFGNTSIEEPFVGYVKRACSWQTVKHLVRATATIVCPVMLVLDRRRGEGLTPSQRHTQLCLRTLGRPLMEKLKHRSRREGTTVTAALIAAALMACQDVSGRSSPLVRFLLSTDLRRFAVNSPLPRPCTLSSVSGSVEFNLRVPSSLATPEAFWRFAKGCREEFRSVIDVSGREGPLLFDVGMRLVNIEAIVENAAASEQTHGRAYTCGLSNAGVWPGRTQYGPISLDGVYYGVTNSQNGCLFQLSCVTVGGRLCVCLQTSAPLIERGEAERFLDVMDRELCRAVDTV